MKIQKYKTAIVLPQNLAILSVRVTRHSPPFIFNATTWKRQLGSEEVEATTWKRQLVTLIGFRRILCAFKAGVRKLQAKVIESGSFRNYDRETFVQDLSAVP